MEKFLFPRWIKQGLTAQLRQQVVFKTHATRPIPFLINIIGCAVFLSRDMDDMPYPTFIDVDLNNPRNVLSINEEPLMGLGKKGTFDDRGITPVSILRKHNSALMYYVGWKRRRYGLH